VADIRTVLRLFATSHCPDDAREESARA